MLTCIRVTVLASSFLLMLPGAWSHSTTIVEFAQLPAGLTAWQRNSFGIYRVCGPMSKLLYALPAHLAGIQVEYATSFDSDLHTRREWEVGKIFQTRNSWRYHDIYRWSRLLPMLVTIVGGCLICEWSTRLFGNWPGIVSLCAWCWTPTILGHGSLVTSDMLSAVALLLAARVFWEFLVKPSVPTSIFCGVTLGLAVATKFTLLVLYPYWALLLTARAFHVTNNAITRPQRHRYHFFVYSIYGIVIILMSLLSVDVAYMFQGVGFRLADLQSGESSLFRSVRQLARLPGTTWLLGLPLPVPIEFVRGLDCQLGDTERLQSAYLLGWNRLGGFWYWYPVASFIKLPIPVLMLLMLAFAQMPSALINRGKVFWASLCLIVPSIGAALAIVSTTGTGTNAAFRYLLPSIALVYVWIGMAYSSCRAASRLLNVGLIGWLAVNAVIGLPDYVGWQNEVGWIWSRWSGRPALIGDSLDWSQDVARLGKWAQDHSSNGSTLVYVYGLGRGEPYGLEFPHARPTSDPGPSPAYLAVSENALFSSSNEECIQVGSSPTLLGQRQRQNLQNRQPAYRVGRSIRIYRIDGNNFDGYAESLDKPLEGK